MDRVTGWYKRRTQWVSFFVALAIAAIFNVNVLYERADLDAAGGHCQLDDITFRGEPGCYEAGPGSATASRLFNALEPAFLVGWVKGPEPYDGPSLFIAITSWLMVAGAALFCASSWFDILQRITHLKGTGPEPKRSAKPRQPDG